MDENLTVRAYLFVITKHTRIHTSLSTMAISNFLRARVQSVRVNDGAVHIYAVNVRFFTHLLYWMWKWISIDVYNLLLLPSLSLSRKNRLSRLLSPLRSALFGLEVRRGINVW